MREANRCLWSLTVFWAASIPAISQEKPSTHPPGQGLFRHHLADYNSELRLANGRVDTDAMVKRLKELGVTTYYWLVWHAVKDWDDLKLFLPKASQAGIEVWVYLVPPSESSPKSGSHYSEPFRLDYRRWAEEIARLSLQHPNLTAWVIDDFYENHEFFTPAYLRELRAKSKAVNPQLAFLPLMYFGELQAQFVEDYRGVIDGVVVAYLQDREEIDRTWAILNDATRPAISEISYPWNMPSRVGNYGMAEQSAKVLPADHYDLRFLERDDFTGETAGYHYKQLLLDGAIVWEEDVAGGSPTWHKVAVDVTRQVRGKTHVTLAFRLCEKKAVSNFGVHWRVGELRAENLQLAADLSEPQKWKVSRQGAFETGFDSTAKIGQRRFHIPFVSMTAGDEGEFRLRHGNPATPERVAQQLRISLQAWRNGKCDGVVTYCLDKGPESPTFSSVQKLFREFGAYTPSPDMKSLTIDFAGGDQAAKRLDIARELVAQMAAGQFEKAVDTFDQTMKRVLPATKLKEVWDGLTKQYGPLQRAVETKTEMVQQYKVVYVTCEFQKGKLDAKVVFTQKKEVTGLFFIPSGGYKPPSYADASKFEEKEITVGKGVWRLPGTLSIPKGSGPFPCVILVHGSGPHDRDETIGPNKSFRDLAHGLATRGIAVLRYEKRTKHHQIMMALMVNSITVKEETIDDAVAAVDAVASQEKIDPKRIFVLGHSLGGMLIPRIGKAAPGVAGFISLAGSIRRSKITVKPC